MNKIKQYLGDCKKTLSSFYDKNNYKIESGSGLLYGAGSGVSLAYENYLLAGLFILGTVGFHAKAISYARDREKYGRTKSR